MFVFVHRKYKIKTFFLAIVINNNIYVIFWTYYKSKFCNSDKSEKIDKPAHRHYKDLKRTKTLLEILINKKYLSII